MTFQPKAFQVIIREGGKKTEGCQTTEDFACRAVQNPSIPSTQLSRFRVFVKRNERRRQRGAEKKEKEISNRNIPLDSA